MQAIVGWSTITVKGSNRWLFVLVNYKENGSGGVGASAWDGMTVVKYGSRDVVRSRKTEADEESLVVDGVLLAEEMRLGVRVETRGVRWHV